MLLLVFRALVINVFYNFPLFTLLLLRVDDDSLSGDVDLDILRGEAGNVDHQLEEVTLEKTILIIARPKLI